MTEVAKGATGLSAKGLGSALADGAEEAERAEDQRDCPSQLGWHLCIFRCISQTLLFRELTELRQLSGSRAGVPVGLGEPLLQIRAEETELLRRRLRGVKGLRGLS